MINPFQSDRLDRGFAMVCTLLTQMFGGKNSKATMQTFMPRYGAFVNHDQDEKDRKKRLSKLSPELVEKVTKLQAQAQMNSLVRRLGAGPKGKVDGSNRKSKSNLNS